ncbi:MULTISPECIES: spore coat protein [Bacillus]|uniref:spore coat protein n=1 Tax=Bacillus TaxID=1386 RepID=UPI0003FB58FA|nr:MULTISPECIES: spore coat protein [Bacillus]MBR0614200.1 spore coat protein [Bacillus safensis]MBR0634853.1 spore coat protein [Bacillus safensis]QNH48672.1 spore coat protein [Bacillus sp. PAMC28571]QNK42967.1 spore coat protein [Bacillus sp. PAMC22265]QWS51623.1 spore coat protein [Bacillus sp. JNUCC-24]
MDSKPYSWVALDRNCTHHGHHRHHEHHDDCNYERKALCDDYYDDEDILQDLDQVSFTKQTSEEVIIVRDSCDINVSSVDAQVAASIQVAIQTAIITITNISIADGDLADRVTQDLLQAATHKQTNRQKLVIENSRNVTVSTIDADISIAIQTLTQTLVATIVAIGIL